MESIKRFLLEETGLSRGGFECRLDRDGGDAAGARAYRLLWRF